MTELIDTLRLARDGRFSARALEFTAIDFETTGLHPGHIVELAAVRTRADGVVLGELSTLVNPGPGISPGPTHVYRITRRELDAAPSLRDVLGHFVELCRGSVLVAHNLPFEKRFLAEELARLGIAVSMLPGICTLSATRKAFDLPNYRLGTVADAIGFGEFPAHTALADARVCARIVSTLVTKHGLSLARQPRFPELPRLIATGPLLPRADAMPVRETSWLGSLADRIPVVESGPDRALEAAYLELLGDALADRYLSDEESRALSAMAAEAGMSANDVRRVHKDFVTAMRTVAESDGIVTAEEERDLKTVAAALGVPELVRDLRPTGATRPKATRVLVLGTTAEADELRAGVLAAGTQLAKKLTASVTHLVVDDRVPETEPRRSRAAELGIPILGLGAAQELFGLTAIAEPAPIPAQDEPTVRIPAPAPAPVPAAAPTPMPVPAPVSASTPVSATRPQFVPVVPPAQVRRQPPQPVRRGVARAWIPRGVMAFGLFLMFVSVTSLAGGAPLGSAIVVAVFGVGALLGGWWLTQRPENDPRRP